ncbi:MAG TPA: glycosyltransferase [Polyangiales bacterium]
MLAPEPRERWIAPSWPGVRVEQLAYLKPRALERTFYGAGVPDNLARDPSAWLGLAPFSARLAHSARRRARHWDALISHWALPCALAAGFARGDRPHIAVLHSADIHLLSRLPLRAALAHGIARSADLLWFVSAEQRARFLALLPPSAARPNTLVCAMGVDLDEAPNVERALSAKRPWRALALGRLVRLKGLDVAIRACAELGIGLMIAGDGPERARLERLASQLNADVRFLGTVVGRAKRELFESADVFMLPSRRMPNGRGEGVPHSLLEALAHGLPVIASRQPGIEELLAGTSLARGLVAADDLAAFIDALRSIRDASTDPSIARAARAIVQPFAWPAIAGRVDDQLALAASNLLTPKRANVRVWQPTSRTIAR